jgi:hypothetical protein
MSYTEAMGMIILLQAMAFRFSWGRPETTYSKGTVLTICEAGLGTMLLAWQSLMSRA